MTWLKKILKSFFFSPINTVFFIALLYFGAQAYFFDPTIKSKLICLAVLAIWIFLFLARHVVLLLVVLGLLGAGSYMYYQYSHKEQRQCEESGRYWNKKTSTCEDNIPLLEQVKRFLKKKILESQTTEK